MVLKVKGRTFLHHILEAPKKQGTSLVLKSVDGLQKILNLVQAAEPSGTGKLKLNLPTLDVSKGN